MKFIQKHQHDTVIAPAAADAAARRQAVMHHGMNYRPLH